MGGVVFSKPALLLGCALVTIAVSGCGGTPEPAPDIEATAPAAATATAEVTAGVTKLTSQVTSTPAELKAGLNVVSLGHDGSSRRLIVLLPQSFVNEASHAVVLAFHGLGGSAAAACAPLRFLVDREGTVVVCPEGTRTRLGVRSWNVVPLGSAEAGALIGLGLSSEADDVGFVYQVLDWLVVRVMVDPSRVYATGHSMGGLFVHKLARESGRFAAVAPVAASTVDVEAFAPTGFSVSVLAVHGQQDPIWPYEGGSFGSVAFASVQDTLALWAVHNGCDPTPEVDDGMEGVTILRHAGCRDSTEGLLYSVEQAGHSGPWRAVGDLYDLIWEFFERNARSASR